MSSRLSTDYLFSQVQNNSTLFSSESPYLTYTLSNGLEIYTINDRQIRVTSLNRSTNSSHKLDVHLEFDPIALCANKLEQLLCLYDSNHCHIISINPPGSLISFTTLYKLRIALKSDESIIQVIFNNVSKFQAEIIILTNTRLLCYDINESLDTPVQSYKFSTDTDISSSIDAETSISANAGFSTLIDPVSISFATSPDDSSSSSPEADLTLFILTSDFSIFRIFPFLPANLSVPKDWLLTLFDQSSAQFKSLADLRLQTQFILTLRFARFLFETSGDIAIKDVLPNEFRRGKIVGPLPITPFFDELYSMDALKLLPLPNDIVCVVANHSLVALSYEHLSFVVFDHQSTIDSHDKFTLVDATIFDSGSTAICNGFVRPPLYDAVLLTTSQPGLVLVDYSDWMKPLSIALQTEDISTFSSLWMNSPTLPTVVTSLGEIKIPSLPSSGTDGIPLTSYQNQLWFAWNENSCLCAALSAHSPGKLTILPIYEGIEEVNEHVLLMAPQEAESVPLFNRYMPLIQGTFVDEVISQLEKSRLQVLKTQRIASQMGNLELDPDSVEHLHSLQRGGQVMTLCVLSLFESLSAISRRLTQLREELKNQVITLNEIKMRKEYLLPKMKKQAERVESVDERQKKLQERVDILKERFGKIVSSRVEVGDVALSKEEVRFSRFLNSTRDFVLKKEEEYGEVKGVVEDVKGAEREPIIVKRKQLKGDEIAKRRLGEMKEKLEAREQVIDRLGDELGRVHIVD
ncbi:DEKNAAC105430 [Brettanomyces naardenensis]|uniref:DEKNAAC105430 n=1 Tax=Brettanomyces naardenensis TaxID=13370 RepID=A0A448YTD5_BRENA|nr:DEKNAAC105430 [Brettanomyces naardenensis]